MKIFTCLLFIALLSINNLQAQSRLVSQSDYNYITNAFVIGDTTTYFFTGNNGGDLTHSLKYSTALEYAHYTNGSKPLDSSALTQQSFDNNNNISLAITQLWDTTTGKWANTKQTFHSYDANNNDTLTTVQLYNPGSMKWFNDARDRLIYVNNNIDTLIFQLYDTTKMQWNNNTRYNYNYTGNNLTRGLIQGWVAAKSDWKNGFLYFNYYDSQNNDTSSVFQNADTSGTKWINYYKEVSSFGNANNVLTGYQLNWDTLKLSFSDSDQAYYYKYDANNNDTSYLQQYYALGKWYNQDKKVYRYNNYNQRTYYELLNPGPGSGFVPVSESYYYYENYTGINTITNTEGNLQLYPNPSSNLIHLSLTLQSALSVQLSLYNLLGQQVWAANMGTAKRVEATVPVNNLSNGVYILKINAGGVMQEKEVVVEK